MTHATTWMDFKGLMLSKKIQSQKVVLLYDSIYIALLK